MSILATKYQASTQYNSNKVFTLYGELGKVKASLDSAIRDSRLQQNSATNFSYKIEQLQVDLVYYKNDYFGYLKAARDSLNTCLKSLKK